MSVLLFFVVVVFSLLFLFFVVVVVFSLLFLFFVVVVVVFSFSTLFFFKTSLAQTSHRV